MQGIIVSVAPAGDLLKVYPGQAGPQPCYLSLSVATGRLWAGANPELCNAVPEAVWHGIVRRYEIPVLQALGQTIIAHGNQHLGEIWLTRELQGLKGIGF